ncbi:MAG: caspase family protein, partial [Gammaproteobacteria bacterium]
FKERTAILWEAASGAERRRFEHQNDIWSLALSPDRRFLATASGPLFGGMQDPPRYITARLWDAGSGELLHIFDMIPDNITVVTFSPDGHVLLIAGGAWLSTWDVATGQLVRRFFSKSTKGTVGGILDAAFSSDGHLLLTGGSDGSAILWEVATGKEIRRLRGHSGKINSVAFSPDGRFVLTGGSDATMRLWNPWTSQELCRLISFPDGTWAVVDPQGRYDASNGGDVHGLHWVIGNESIALDQLKERYYEPGLLAKIMGFNKEPLRQVSAFKQVGLFPQIETQAPVSGSTVMEIKLTNRGGGIGRVRILVNGKEVAADARGPTIDPHAAKAGLTVDLARAAIRPGEPNIIEVVAWNAEGYLSSRSAQVIWTAPGTPAAKPTDLYAIVGGVSTYASPHLNLRFAAKDAEDVAKALQIGAKRLFGAEKVHLSLLRTTSDTQTLSPTKANFRRAFEEARKAAPTDILVVYLAGHGVVLRGEHDLYGYLTKEARSTDLSDPAVRGQVAITSEELVEWTKAIPALKQVMVLDTCGAGAAADKLVEKREIPADQIRAMERMKDRTGFHILAGSAADKVSYEASRYGQGLLTYTLLQGLRGAALRDGEYADISTLFQYARDQVPQLAREIGGIQEPRIAAPRGDSFDIGQFTKEDKAAIPLAMIKPLILRPVLLNPEQGFDNLELTAALRRQLQADTDTQTATRGPRGEPAAIFVDADELPGGIRPSGTYTVEGRQVKVKLFLIRDGLRVANFEIEAANDDPTRVAIAIVEGLTRALQGLAP